MQVEHVAGEGFTSRRTTEQQGHLAISHGLLGKVIVNDEGVLAVVAIEFRHRAAGVGRNVLQRCRVGRGGGNDGGVLKRAVAAQGIGHQSHRGLLLADGHVEAVDVRFFLRQDGVNTNSGLTSLAVANDKFALSATNRRHGVNGFQTRRHWFMHALTRDDAGGLDFHGAHCGSLDGAQAVDGLTQGVEHTAHNAVADRHGEDLAGTFDRVAFLDAYIRTEQSNTDVVLFEVEHHAHDATGKFQQFH